MNFGIQLDLSALNDLDQLQEQVTAVGEASLDALAARGLELKLEQVEETYSRPESRGTTRTGAFREGQSIESEPGVRRVGVRGRAEAYEPHLQVLATGRDGINRSNPAARKAHERLEAEVPDILDKVVRDVLD